MSARFVVGQEVILRERRYGGTVDIPVTISRVGRKYVYIPARYGNDRAFFADSGAEKGHNYNASYLGGRLSRSLRRMPTTTRCPA